MPWGSDWHRGSQEVRLAQSRCTFSRRNHFSSFPSVHLPAVQEVTSGASESFRRNQFSSCPGIGLAPRKLGGKARAESLHFFSTEPLFLIPPAQISGSLKPRDRGSQRASLRFCSRSPFLILFNSPETLGRTRAFSRSAFVSSSLHGDSGIPAVPKTGASVLRLLPPTS